MPGMRCWDATGKLVVDIGDYNVRYMGALSLKFPAGVTVIDVPYPDMSNRGWVVCPTAVQGDFPYKFMCLPYNGGFKMVRLNAMAAERILSVEVFSYI